MFLAYVCLNLFYLLYKWLIFISNKFMSLININISVKFQYRFFRFRIEAFWIFEREWLHYRFFFLCCCRYLNWRRNWDLNHNFQLIGKMLMNQQSSCSMRFRVWKLRRWNCLHECTFLFVLVQLYFLPILL